VQPTAPPLQADNPPQQSKIHHHLHPSRKIEVNPRALLANTFHYVGYLQPLELVIARSGTLGRIDEMLADPDYEYRAHIGDVRS
jgi:hypothetical protein